MIKCPECQKEYETCGEYNTHHCPSAESSGYACPLGKNEWRHGNGYICCGSMRIFRTDIDTNPSEQFTKELLDWVVATLNKA